MPCVTPTASALAEALMPDPFYLAVTADHAGDPVRRLAVLGAYIDQAQDEAPVLGCCTWAEPPEAGAAVWHWPQGAEVAARAAAAKQARLQAVLGPRGFANYRAIVDFMAPRAEAVVPAQAWYLSIAGIAPPLQGRGAGARMLAPVLARATAAGQACFLETFTPRNLPFYERLGFRSVAAYAEPVTGSTYWVMVRY